MDPFLCKGYTVNSAVRFRGDQRIQRTDQENLEAVLNKGLMIIASNEATQQTAPLQICFYSTNMMKK